MTDLRVVKPPDRHLANVLLEAESLFDQGDYTKGVQLLCRAVLIAGTAGGPTMAAHELLFQLRRISPHFDGDDGGAEAA